MDTIKSALTSICTAGTILFVVAGLLLYGISNVTDTSGAKGHGALITCAIGAIACGLAIPIIQTLQN